MDGLKQRVVGALVIVSLAVIFLPMIFDEPHQVTKKQIIQIPIQPELPVITIGSAQKPSYKLIESPSSTARETETETETEIVKTETVVAKGEGVSEAKEKVKVPNDSPKVKPVKTAPALASPEKTSEIVEPKAVVSVFNKETLKNVWMVQLGTFGNHANANRLRDQLRSKGYDGHTTKLDKDGNVLIRVFSGPYADKVKASEIKKQLDRKFKVKSLVVHFK